MHAINAQIQINKGDNSFVTLATRNSLVFLGVICIGIAITNMYSSIKTK